MPPLAPLAHILTLLVLLSGSESASPCNNVTLVSTQLDALLATYDRAWSPQRPVLVDLSLDVRHATINDASATVKLLADLRMTWVDKRLVWNASEWRCDMALVSAERLWLPDVGLLSAAASARDAGDSALRALLAADGRVAWTQRLDLAAPLELDLTDWPRDSHQITFKFGSRQHFTDEFELSINIVKNDETSEAFEAGAWDLVSVEGSEWSVERAGGKTRVAAWAVRLRRRAAAHGLAAGAVLLAAYLLLLAAGLQPPASRPALCAAASLVATLWLVSASARVGSAALAQSPRLLALVGAVCAAGGAAAALAALACSVARCSLPPPRALRSLLNHAALLRRLTPLQVQGAEESSAWAAAAQLLDALCLLLLLLVLLVVLALYH